VHPAGDHDHGCGHRTRRSPRRGRRTRRGPAREPGLVVESG
jgi:hypothetical protein